MISMNIYLITQVRNGIKPDKTDKPGFQTGIYPDIPNVDNCKCQTGNEST